MIDPSLRYLWSNRTRHGLLTSLWWKNWAKRAWQLPSLALTLGYAGQLRARGARIGKLSTLSRSRFMGRWPNLCVGDFTFVGRIEAQLLAPLVIGDCVVINDGVRILTGTHDIDSSDFRLICRGVTIGNYAWICTAALVLPGVQIGQGAVVAAGAVVSRDVPPHAVVAGNPARMIKSRQGCEFDYRPTQFRACFEAWINKPW